MFTIEHDFDSTVITLIDETEANTRLLFEDVTIRSFDDQVVLEQLGHDGETVARIALSDHQLTELRAALNLPEGNYRLTKS